MKPKILIFSLAYYPKHIGGAEVAIKEITDRLGDVYDFHLISNRYDSTLPKTEKIGNVTVHRIGITTKEPSMGDLRKLPLHLNKIFYQWQAFWVAKKLHKQVQFDGIWAMMVHATGVPAAKFKRTFPDVPYMLTLQEGDPPEYIEKKMKVFGKDFQDAFINADAIQVISTFLGDWATRRGFKGNPVLIPNAVNTEKFSKETALTERKAVRDAWGVADTDTVLITTSRLVKKNGIDTVIEAMPKISNAQFIVYGTGPDEEMLRALANKLEVSDRVHFLGQLDHAEMPKHLQAANIFIRPSRSEGMGNSFIEAMAAGIPVIATQEGGIADFLFDADKNPDKQTTGWAVTTENADDIAQAVARIVSDEAATQAVVQNAKEMVMKSYDWDLIASRMDAEVFQPTLQ